MSQFILKTNNLFFDRDEATKESIFNNLDSLRKIGPVVTENFAYLSIMIK